MLRLQDQDRLWVQQIKSALMENRFRLVQQPIASLVGDDLGMFDVLVRMLDAQGQEVLPSGYRAPPSFGVRPAGMQSSYCMAHLSPLMGPSMTSVHNDSIFTL